MTLIAHTNKEHLERECEPLNGESISCSLKMLQESLQTSYYIIFLKTEKDIEKFTIFHCLRYSAGALGKV